MQGAEADQAPSVTRRPMREPTQQALPGRRSLPRPELRQTEGRPTATPPEGGSGAGAERARRPLPPLPDTPPGRSSRSARAVVGSLPRGGQPVQRGPLGRTRDDRSTMPRPPGTESSRGTRRQRARSVASPPWPTLSGRTPQAGGAAVSQSSVATLLTGLGAVAPLVEQGSPQTTAGVGMRQRAGSSPIHRAHEPSFFERLRAQYRRDLAVDRAFSSHHKRARKRARSDLVNTERFRDAPPDARRSMVEAREDEIRDALYAERGRIERLLPSVWEEQSALRRPAARWTSAAVTATVKPAEMPVVSGLPATSMTGSASPALGVKVGGVALGLALHRAGTASPLQRSSLGGASGGLGLPTQVVKKAHALAVVAYKARTEGGHPPDPAVGVDSAVAALAMRWFLALDQADAQPLLEDTLDPPLQYANFERVSLSTADRTKLGRMRASGAMLSDDLSMGLFGGGSQLASAGRGTMSVQANEPQAIIPAGGSQGEQPGAPYGTGGLRPRSQAVIKRPDSLTTVVVDGATPGEKGITKAHVLAVVGWKATSERRPVPDKTRGVNRVAAAVGMRWFRGLPEAQAAQLLASEVDWVELKAADRTKLAHFRGSAVLMAGPESGALFGGGGAANLASMRATEQLLGSGSRGTATVQGQAAQALLPGDGRAGGLRPRSGAVSSRTGLVRQGVGDASGRPVTVGPKVTKSHMVALVALRAMVDRRYSTPDLAVGVERVEAADAVRWFRNLPPDVAASYLSRASDESVGVAYQNGTEVLSERDAGKLVRFRAAHMGSEAMVGVLAVNEDGGKQSMDEKRRWQLLFAMSTGATKYQKSQTLNQREKSDALEWVDDEINLESQLRRAYRDLPKREFSTSDSEYGLMRKWYEKYSSGEEDEGEEDRTPPLGGAKLKGGTGQKIAGSTEMIALPSAQAHSPSPAARSGGSTESPSTTASRATTSPGARSTSVRGPVLTPEERQRAEEARAARAVAEGRTLGPREGTKKVGWLTSSKKRPSGPLKEDEMLQALEELVTSTPEARALLGDLLDELEALEQLAKMRTS